MDLEEELFTIFFSISIFSTFENEVLSQGLGKVSIIRPGGDQQGEGCFFFGLKSKRGNNSDMSDITNPIPLIQAAL